MKRALLLLTLPACLSVPDKAAPMCATTSDCDAAHGEICDDGVCWGNPPAGAFSAIVTPPSSRTNLVTRELATIGIASDGWIDPVQLENPVVYTASLACQAPIACDDSLLVTTITVSRASTFPGGPGFKSIVKTTGSRAFSIAVPPPHDGEKSATYTITVVPDGRDEMGSSTTPAQVLPPLRTQLTIDGNASGKVIEMGGLSLPTISGVIKNDAGQPQQNYRVVALGRWDYTSAPTEVSTVDFTGSDGTFQIQLSAGLTPQVELVARPVVTTTRPTLHYVANIALTGFQNLALQWPQEVGQKVDLSIPVKAVDGNGEVKPARGARVVVSSKVAAPLGDATYVAEATTDDSGIAKLSVLDGDIWLDDYRISIIPQANSQAGVVYDQPFSLLQPIPAQQLTRRVALRGVVYMDGEPVKDMSITAHPSLRFVWSLDGAPQAFLSAIPPATTVTPDTGEFVLWVDPNLVDTWGFYDLALEGAEGSGTPNLTISAVELPRVTSQTQVTLPVIDLPKPAYVRAPIVDDKGSTLEGAELKLYKSEDFGALCMEVSHPPQNCPTLAATATLMGRGTSDEDGEARLTLPRMNQP